jgi:hypothetical protein
MLDDIQEKQLGYNMSQAKEKETMADLKVEMRNRLLTDEQRIEAGNRYLELARKIAGENTAQAKGEVAAFKVMAEQKTKLGMATIAKYLEERPYNDEKIKKANDYLDALKNEQKYQALIAQAGSQGYTIYGKELAKIQTTIKETTNDTKIYSTVVEKVNRLSEEQQKQISDGYVKVSEKRAEAKESTMRASTLIHSLLAKQGDGMEKADNQAAASAEKLGETQKEKAEKQLKFNIDMIAANNVLIVGMTRKSIDSQIAAMVEGADKEKALAKDKYEDDKISIAQETEKKLRDIQDAVDATKAVKPSDKAGKEKQLADIAEFEKQKLAITANGNALNEENERLHQAKIKEIEAKFSGKTEDGKITKDYSQNVANAVADNNMQLEVTRQFYASKGTLTQEEEKQQAADILKINIDLFQKKYELLKTELAARKKAGFISVEDEKAALAEIAKLYGEVKKATGEGNDAKRKEPTSLKGKVTGAMADMLGISPEGASAIYDKAGEILGNLKDMFLSAQQDKIKAELKAENAKIDKSYQYELKGLNDRKKKGLLTDKQYEDQKEQLDQQTAIKKDRLAREAFEKNKKLQIKNAIIGGAVAAVSMLAAGFPLGLIMAALTAITVGLQIATISNTKYEGAKGGMLRGPSHKEGGIKYAMGGDILELEGGEAVLNKRSMESRDLLSLSGTPRDIASSLNSYNGYGVKFSSGGYTPVATPRSQGVRIDRQSLDQTISDKIQSMKVYVVDSEITDQQDKTKKIKVESTW